MAAAVGATRTPRADGVPLASLKLATLSTAPAGRLPASGADGNPKSQGSITGERTNRVEEAPRLMKDAKLWLLVADQGRARLFSAMTARGALEELHDVIAPRGRMRDQDLTTDRPGRSFDSSGSGRHAMEPSTDPTEVEAINFAKSLADILNKGRMEGRYRHLGIVAPPAFLGHLRQQMTTETSRELVLEIDKDLTRLDAAAIRDHLPERLFDMPS